MPIRKSRAIIPFLLMVITSLVILRLALPSIVEREINGRLADMGDYSGRVEGVRLALWRGAYSVYGLEIEKRGKEVPVPLLDVPSTAISLAWRKLLRGGIVANVRFEAPTLHFVDGSGDDDTQAGTGVNWRQYLEDIIPIRLDEVLISNGTVVFHNFLSDPPVDLEASAVEAAIRNLTNVRDESGRRIAEMTATATLFGSGELEAEAHFDPFEALEDFDFALRILEVDLTRINDLAQAYANLDFESGNGELVLELQAADGNLSGYAKPLFQKMQIFSLDSIADSDKSPLEIAWEALAEVVTSIFTNQPAEQFGTRIEISGEIDDPDLDPWSAIVGILRNAFVEAFRPYFEGVRLPAREGE